MDDKVKIIDLAEISPQDFEQHYVGSIVLTKDNKILLQQRGINWNRYPGYLAEFGGRIEKNETPINAIIRELHEELGAVVHDSELVFLGAITEEITHYKELIHTYFWHDTLGTITGCYEGEAKSFDTLEEAMNGNKLMSSLRFLLLECKKHRLLPQTR